jgi:hypothetical protein
MLVRQQATITTDTPFAEAYRRAAAAELALAKFREPRQLSVKGNEAFITERLRPFAGTRFDSGIAGSGEVADIWWTYSSP